MFGFPVLVLLVKFTAYIGCCWCLIFLPSPHVFNTFIGTGASCIYPLLGAKKNKWRFLASEMDPTSFSYAQNNVTKNGLQDLITGQWQISSDIAFCSPWYCFLFWPPLFPQSCLSEFCCLINLWIKHDEKMIIKLPSYILHSSLNIPKHF